MSIIRKVMTLSFLALPLLATAQKKDSIGTVIDEVVWVVGDEAILRSDVEAMQIIVCPEDRLQHPLRVATKSAVHQ